MVATLFGMYMLLPPTTCRLEDSGTETREEQFKEFSPEVVQQQVVRSRQKLSDREEGHEDGRST